MILSFTQGSCNLVIVSVNSKFPQHPKKKSREPAYLQALNQGIFCVGTRGYGVPGNENDESIIFCSLYVSIVLV